MDKPEGEAHDEIRVDIPPELVDTVCDYLVENIANGMVLEEEEGSAATTIMVYAGEGSDAVANLQRYLTRLFTEQQLPVPEVKQRRIPNIAWLESYRASIKPVRINDDIVVRPPWAEPQGARFELIVEPRMAFGTGSHGTTRGSLASVGAVLQPDMRFLDMGCGSGILSILADRMGAGSIKAVDYDPEATENAGENFRINGVATAHEVCLGSIETCDNDQPYDLVVANIIRTTILEMLDRLLALTSHGGFLILSGLLPQDEEAISSALHDHGETSYSIRRDDEWLTYTVHRK
ncbi:MAG: 50S ribosomal protein L11 methyltransferase [candidate division Zixibacteria bacterium]|nr:50S ribosomal protein L11 methyltransferase [candidate division Zixibacteria bacterium]